MERRTARSVLEYLVGQGVVPCPPGRVPSSLDELLEAFRMWMVLGRGLAEPTIVRYLRAGANLPGPA